MITLIDREYYSGRLTFTGLSTDEKPEEIFINDNTKKYVIKNGSLFYCIDSGEAFLYDAESHVWYKNENASWVAKQLGKLY